MVDQQPLIDRFAGLLLDRNREVNVTSALDPAAVAEHIADALRLVPYIASPYVDVGSGGGLPAIPLAIATGATTTLIESIEKKAAFLRDAIADLQLDATVLALRAETVAHASEHRERYAAATARAVGPATTVLELTVPLLAVGGLAILQRGAPAPGEAQAVSDACLVLGALVEREVRQAGVRRLLLVRKVVPTSARFPRRVGVPRKRPLCE